MRNPTVSESITHLHVHTLRIPATMPPSRFAMPVSKLLASLAFVVAAAAAEGAVPRPTNLKCTGNAQLGEDASLAGPVPASLQPKAFELLPLGSTQPSGWLLNQLVLQANSLSGWMAVSTFPGADTVNSSLWIGGDGHKGGACRGSRACVCPAVSLAALPRSAPHVLPPCCLPRCTPSVPSAHSW